MLPRRLAAGFCPGARRVAGRDVLVRTHAPGGALGWLLRHLRPPGHLGKVRGEGDAGEESGLSKNVNQLMRRVIAREYTHHAL